MKKAIFETLDRLKPAMLMVVVQIGFSAVNVLYKLAVNDGMSLKIIIAYRFTFATAFILPLALILERDVWKNISWMVLFQAFLCGLFGASLAQNFYLKSLALTSPTFISAMFNLVPAITFILTVSLRMERLNLGKKAGKIKLLGALMGMCGALLLIFYKGVEIPIFSTHIDLLHRHNENGSTSLLSPSSQPHNESKNHALGSLFAVGSCISFSLWLIIQAKMSERFTNLHYSSHYSCTALMLLMGSIQTLAYALCTERDWTQWRLGWNIRFLTVAYSGIVGSGLMIVLMTWCLKMRGPLFVSVFNPLMLVLVALAGSLLLNEMLHLGTILAAVSIVLGLYMVLWGKAQEVKKITQLAPLDQIVEEPQSSSLEIVVASKLENINRNDNDSNSSSIMK
ncbi:hypothetical protein UlMin_019994 [Ulmus minor]